MSKGESDFRRELAEMLEQPPEERMTWFYLSFEGDEGFLGGCVVQADTLEAALSRSWELGINLGGEVMSMGPLKDAFVRGVMGPWGSREAPERGALARVGQLYPSSPWQLPLQTFRGFRASRLKLLSQARNTFRSDSLFCTTLYSQTCSECVCGSLSNASRVSSGLFS
jgi:hypothetical protein